MTTDNMPTDEADDADDDEHPNESGGSEGVPAAALASNWRTVLIVDAMAGIAVFVVGVVASIAWNPIGGGLIGSLAVVYVILVVRRGRQWAHLRREHGLPT